MNSKRPSTEQVRAFVSDQMSGQYVRGNSALTRTSLDQLHIQLVEAAEAYFSGPQKQRQAVCDAVMATTDFLKGQGFGDATLAPMKRIVVAMVELCNQNRPDPLFCEKLRKSKSKRSLESLVLQGHLAALADAWLQAYSDENCSEVEKIDRAVRSLSGKHFGNVTRAMLKSVRSYQRQTNQNDIIYSSYEQMEGALSDAAKAAGGGKHGLRVAIDTQVKALNEKAELLQS